MSENRIERYIFDNVFTIALYVVAFWLGKVVFFGFFPQTEAFDLLSPIVFWVATGFYFYKIIIKYISSPTG